ncbi:hypothetical protein BH09SUM1_BH09SUM1_28310 [soil metagenome]
MLRFANSFPPTVLCALLFFALVARADATGTYSPLEIPPQAVDMADEFRPDSHGFLILQSTPIVEVPHDTTVASTKVDIRRVASSFDTTTSETFTTYRRSYYSPFNESSEQTTTIKNFWARGNGSLESRLSSSGTHSQNGGDPLSQGSGSSSLELLNLEEISGESHFITNRQGGAGPATPHTGDICSAMREADSPWCANMMLSTRSIHSQRRKSMT